FQQDNDPKHRCKVAEEFFTKKRICHLDWPPSSPDLNIIEYAWDQLDHLVHAHKALP
ncbi:transposable element Tcb2 transposase, partial [Macrolepiota fuliginosa MF-IS2]